MPELPEVQTVCRTLTAVIAGRRVVNVTIHRRDVIAGSAAPTALGMGQRIEHITRHGKQLALVLERSCLCVHLGMTGSLICQSNGDRPRIHTHITWHMEGGQRLAFADPRRFGGVWTYRDLDALRKSRWADLGPDALTIVPSELARRLSKTRRAVKAALLDQQVIAGLGNIYVDELLFRCRINPAIRAHTLAVSQIRPMVQAMRSILTASIKAGGTTLRDYVDGAGRTGGYQVRRQVHGQMNKPCRRCGSTLLGSLVGGRTTVSCPLCQPMLLEEDK